MTHTITVDIWSDIACPWCYIGKRRFEAGAKAFRARHPDVDIKVERHSFELAPDTPLDFDGSEIDFLVQHKGMPEDQVRGMLAQMTELAAAEGITFDFDRLRHTNTARAHRVLHLAAERGLQSEMLDRVFRAYFSEGELISDPDVLARLGSEVGLDADEVTAALDDEAYGAAVERDITRARMLRVNSVPFFLLDHKYGVPGAQNADAFERVLEQVLGLQGQAEPEAQAGSDA